LDKVKEELVKALTNKRQHDKSLAQLELQIHNLEGAYLNDTAGHGGNIITGFEHYLKTTAPPKKRHEIGDHDRMFSNSSITYAKSIELLQESDDEDKRSANGLTTITLTPASRPPEMTAGQLKRERDREYQRKKRANNKRAMSIASTDDMEMVPKRTTKRQRMMDEGSSIE